MSQVIAAISISLDGYAAGPNQRLDAPFGDGVGERLHEWMFEYPEGNEAEIAALTDAGAFIIGRNMFTPGRGEWDLNWKGYWGDDPPYHAPVFVLSHYPRDPLPMAGGTTFTFVTDGIEPALEQARAAAGASKVAIMGGPETINQYLAAGLIDELRIHLVPITIGGGTRVFDGIPPLELDVVAARHTPHVTHLTYRRK